MKGQIDLFSEIIVDNFAGGGGASTGIELATGKVVDIAINHDPDAILMHKTNHPYTEHIQASVWDVDPVEVCRGRPVGLAWFSPDCKHFSKAKGAALVDRNIRGLAWIVLRWAAKVRPRMIILENVEEFQTWGPVRKGRPIKSKAGKTFDKWKSQLKNLGYHIEHRELVAADYGAPTIRKRFVLVARCDNQPIVWPERTHAPANSEDVRSGKCKPWKCAAEIIDWSLPMYSIFSTKKEIKEKYGVNVVRPLAENTLRRVIRGVDKFTIKSGKPFLVPTGYGERSGQAPRTHDINAPLPTVVSSAKHNVCDPVLSPVTFPNTSGSVGSPADMPIHTVTTDGKQVLQAAQLVQYHTEKSEKSRTESVDQPMKTIDASNRYGLVSANLVEYFSTGRAIDLAEPMHTATSHDREALTAAHLCKYYGGVVGAGVEDPLPTVTGIDHNALCASHIAVFKGNDVGQPTNKPLRSIMAQGGELGLVESVICRYSTEDDLGNWEKIRVLLNKHCGYSLKSNEILLLRINGSVYYIRDILLRMLAPKELYAGMGFPPDYIIDRDYLGNEYGKTKQVARCGNAVCPPMAEAVVRANYEASAVYISNMAQLEEIVSARVG